MRATQAYWQYVEATEREKPRRARGSAAAGWEKGAPPAKELVSASSGWAGEKS
jgi:hypothetical protein